MACRRRIKGVWHGQSIQGLVDEIATLKAEWEEEHQRRLADIETLNARLAAVYALLYKWKRDVHIVGCKCEVCLRVRQLAEVLGTILVC